MRKLKPNQEKIPKYKVIKSGEWIFEVTAIRALKVGDKGVYGDSYDAIATINIIDGKAHINSAIGDFTRKCFRTIFNYVKSRGIKAINYKRMKNLKDKPNKIKINN